MGKCTPFYRLILVSLSLLMGGVTTSAPGSNTPDEKQTPVVLVDQVRKSSLFDTITYPGRMVPRASSPVVVDADGVVTKVMTGLGQSVTRGTPLFVIENSDPAYHYAPQKVIAELSGAISSLDVTEGARVQKGTRLATITDVSLPKILIEIAAADLAALRPGMKGEMSIAAHDQRIAVRIKGISPIIDPATGTASCDVETISKDEKGLFPGAIGQIDFNIKQHQGFAVKEQTIVYRGKEPFVRLVIDNKIKYQKVTLGPRRGEDIEIIGGLTEGALIVSRANSYIADGEKVIAKASEVAKK